MKHLFERFTNIILTLSMSVIVFAGVFAVLFFVLLPHYRPVINPEHIVMPPLANGKVINGQDLLEPGSDLGTLVAISILMVVGLVGLSGFSIYGHMRHQKLERDKRRRQDLETVRLGFETYRAIHGRYPMSSTYQPEYYTGINLSKDWNYYGLPNTEQMRAVIKEWPLSDPSLDYNGSNQTNQYLYYPRNQGRSFDLYAHLELPKSDEGTDYNAIDNLLRAWGNYNYKVSSSGQPAAPSLEAVAQAGRPLTAEELAMQQSIVEQAIPSDSNQVNAELKFLADEVVADAKPPLPEPISAPSATMPVHTPDQLGALNQAVAAKQTIHQPGELPLQEILPEGNQQ